MLNAFDSRALGFADTYGQRFMREGTYRYAAGFAGFAALDDDLPFAVEVGEGDPDTMTQHTVMLEYEGRVYRPDPPVVKIEVGDLVTWACRDPRAPAFEVVGDQDFFQSARLRNESGYAHAFGTAGEYPWVDAHGSGLKGMVRVRDPDVRDRQGMLRWRRSLEKGALVMIDGEEAEPAETEIETGQTVYFAVTKTPGISITDARLVEAEGAVARGPEQRTYARRGGSAKGKKRKQGG